MRRWLEQWQHRAPKATARLLHPQQFWSWWRGRCAVFPEGLITLLLGLAKHCGRAGHEVVNQIVVAERGRGRRCFRRLLCQRRAYVARRVHWEHGQAPLLAASTRGEVGGAFGDRPSHRPLATAQDATLETVQRSELRRHLVEALVESVGSEIEWQSLRTCVQHVSTNGVTLQERLAEEDLPVGTYRSAIGRVFERAERALRGLGYA
jgi:hypothetical protein